MGNAGSTTLASYLGMKRPIETSLENALALAPYARNAFLRKHSAAADARSGLAVAAARAGAIAIRLDDLDSHAVLANVGSLEDVWRELLVFLALHRYTESDETLEPPAAVAVAWHQLLLYTHEYAAVCRELAGRFVHHWPKCVDEQAERRVSAYVRTCKLYERALGCPPWKIWPGPLEPLAYASGL